MILSFLSFFKKKVAALFCTDIAAQGFGYVSYQAHLVQCGFIYHSFIYSLQSLQDL